MSTYYYIGCEVCREQVNFLSRSAGGFGPLAGSQRDVPLFMLRHEDCVPAGTDHLRIFTEHNERGETFTEFAAPKE